ncbi:MAG: transporter, family, tartrate transporter [Acetobacteraceae bacterium]|jgi:ACS family tartrate transporter-like MFS transporter|nr:transporter, family, tartrate transporter [Acetobacteraceae bacterium]
MTPAIETVTMRKVYLHLLPFTFALYLICYLDRANIGFAALTMNRDLGLSSYVYGLGAGAFFWGYFLLEVPSNLILERVGARRWIARIMITWGIVSGSFAFVNGPVSFFVLRFLLGLAEAGFFPGMILYFTYWFPPYHRARIIAGFMAAIPVSIGIGAPISTALLELNGVLGLAGWKWLFLAEAAPALILGVFVLFYLTDRPSEAKWLSADERDWLVGILTEEKRRVEAERPVSVWQSLINPRVIALGAIHFAQAGVSVGIAVFVTLIIKQLGLSNMQTGWLTAVPFIFGTIGILVWGGISDRMNERKWNLTLSCLCMAAGLVLAAMFVGTYLSIAGLSVAMIGLYASNAHLFPIPSMFLTGAAAASGIAWVNSLGILAGGITSPVIGYIRDATGSYQNGLYFLAALAAMGALVAVIGVRETAAKLAPGITPAE